MWAESDQVDGDVTGLPNGTNGRAQQTWADAFPLQVDADESHDLDIDAPIFS
jgi:hypothetical protein